MKKHLLYLVLFFVLLFSGTIKAEFKHYGGVSLGVGEWSLLPFDTAHTNNADKLKPSIGGAGAFTLQYEMQYRPHAYSPVTLLFDVGLGVKGGWTNFNQSVLVTDTLKDQINPTFPETLPDVNGNIILNANHFDYIYKYASFHQDQYWTLGLNIPLMVGLQYNHIYALAGVKLNFNVIKEYRAMGSAGYLSTYADYTAIRSIAHNMPRYQYFENIVLPDVDNQWQDCNKSFELDGSLEIGYRLGDVAVDAGFDVPKRKIEYRIAAFADFGIFDWRSKNNGGYDFEGMVNKNYVEDLFVFNENENAYVFNPNATGTDMIDGVFLQDIMQTKSYGKVVKSVHNLFVGIKFTVLFELPLPKQCVICHDSYRSIYKSGRGRGVKYEEE